MAVLLPKSVFLHVPKTGGTYVEQVFTNSSIASEILDKRHIGLNTLLKRQPDIAGKFKFAMVRHPLNWWRSRYYFRKIGPRDEESVDAPKARILNQASQTMDFASYIELVLDDPEQLFSRRLERFLGRDYQSLNFVGRQENLIVDLCAAMEEAGEHIDFDVNSLRAQQHANVSNSSSEVGSLPSSLERELLKAESRILEFFNYDDDPKSGIGKPPLRFSDSSQKKGWFRLFG